RNHRGSWLGRHVDIETDGSLITESLHQPAKVTLFAIGGVAAELAGALLFFLLPAADFCLGPLQVSFEKSDLRCRRHVFDTVEKTLVEQRLRPRRVRTFLVHVIDLIEERISRRFLFRAKKKRLYLFRQAMPSFEDYPLFPQIFLFPVKHVSKKRGSLVIQVVTCCKHGVAVVGTGPVHHVPLDRPAERARRSFHDPCKLSDPPTEGPGERERIESPLKPVRHLSGFH